MTTQQVIDIANRIRQIDGRVSAYAEGGMIKGRFRGEVGEDYCYMVSSQRFLYNNEGPNVRRAVEQAVTEITKNDIF